MKVLQTKINFASSYSQLDINSLKLGERLVFSIFIKREDNYVVVIEAGTVLSQILFEKLQKKDKLYISKDDKNKQNFTCKNLYTYIKYNKNDLKKSLELIYEINNKLFDNFLNSKEDIIEIDCIGEIIKSIILLVEEHPNYLKETIPYFNNDSQLPYHSLHVSIYAINLSHFLHLNNLQLSQIGLAGLLHDIGIKKINDSIINKDSKLDMEEVELVHHHSQYSCDIAKKNYVHDPYILDAIMHHHESHDGSGYPDLLKDKDISKFASIISISDVFDALTSNRSYRKKHSTFDALKIMMKEESTINKFKQEYLKIFLQSFLK